MEKIIQLWQNNYRGFSREKMYQELDLEYLHQRKWMRRLCLLHKVLSTKQPALFMSYFHQCGNVNSWNKFDPDILDSSDYRIFR